MKEYTVKKVLSPMTIEDERWDKVTAEPFLEGWEEQFKRKYDTSVKVVYSDEGLYIRFDTTEWPVKVCITKYNDQVCLDSCMELFFTPNLVDKEYFNLEVNAGAVTNFGYGEGRPGRKKTLTKDAGIEVKTLIRSGEGWSLFEFIPFDFLKKNFSSVAKEMRANFYKCGDETAYQHYDTWNKVISDEPDYHRPECFGKLVLSEETI